MPELNITYPYESVSWSPEGGYPESVRVDEVPWRSWGPGSHLGLTVVLDANLDEYYCSSEVSMGFKVPTTINSLSGVNVKLLIPFHQYSRTPHI